MATKKTAKKAPAKKSPAKKKPAISAAAMKKFQALVNEGKSMLAERNIAKVVGEVEARKIVYKLQNG